MHVAASAGSFAADNLGSGSGRVAADTAATGGTFAVRLQSAMAEQARSNGSTGKKATPADSAAAKGRNGAAKKVDAGREDADTPGASKLESGREDGPADGVNGAAVVASEVSAVDGFPVSSEEEGAEAPSESESPFSLRVPMESGSSGPSSGSAGGAAPPPAEGAADVSRTPHTPSQDETAVASNGRRSSHHVPGRDESGIGLRIGSSSTMRTTSDGTAGKDASARPTSPIAIGPPSVSNPGTRTSLSRPGRAAHPDSSGADSNSRTGAIGRRTAVGPRVGPTLVESPGGGGDVPADVEGQAPGASPAVSASGTMSAEEERMRQLAHGEAPGSAEGSASVSETMPDAIPRPEASRANEHPAPGLSDLDDKSPVTRSDDPNSGHVRIGEPALDPAGTDSEAEEARPSRPVESAGEARTMPPAAAEEQGTDPAGRAGGTSKSGPSGSTGVDGAADVLAGPGADGAGAEGEADGDGQGSSGRSTRFVEGMSSREAPTGASRTDAMQDFGSEGAEGGPPESAATGSPSFSALHAELAQSEVEFVVEKDQDADLSTLAERMQELVESVVRERGPGGQERVAIKLHPEHLGRLVLHIGVDEAGIVHARFAADNAVVRSMIEQDLPQLRASLEANGLVLGEAGVHSDTGSDFGPDHGTFFADGRDSSHRRGAAHSSDKGRTPATEAADGSDAAVEAAVQSLGTIDIRI